MDCTKEQHEALHREALQAITEQLFDSQLACNAYYDYKLRWDKHHLECLETKVAQCQMLIEFCDDFIRNKEGDSNIDIVKRLRNSKVGELANYQLMIIDFKANTLMH